MMDVYVVEDQKDYRNRLVEIIENMIMIENYEMNMKLDTDNPYELLEHCSKSINTGIYFLDVNLNCDINGIQLAEKIRQLDSRGFIIFVTTHAEMSCLTFKYKVEALDYIIKDQFLDLGNRVQQCLKNINDKYSSFNNNTKKNISIKLLDRQIIVAHEKILFFETSDTPHKVILHCIDRQIEFYGQLSELSEQFHDGFVRCHRSFLVNKENIRQIDRQSKVVIMKNNQNCYYSSRGAKLLKEFV